jgi:uncharacterized membrane protein
MMESKVTIYGHPVHPMIIVLPLGLLPASIFTDLLYHTIDDPTWGNFSFWLIVAGVLSGLAAGVIGFMDWKGLPVGTKARRIGAIHGLTNVVAIVVFLASLLLRFGDPSRPTPFATSMAVIGLFIAMLGGWLGGELVFRLGVGVHQSEESNPTPERSV